ncbi:MAG: nitroreductase family protein [Prolixibacteraceae bacterium]|nr:nitroreductase family protein [Prolixibacteraceae bacterium]MBN2775014.1 nitroreductase family protein [Prolixibacteraceae bacterium]
MIELLRQRRTIRIYKNIKIEPEKIEILKEALLRSPSSKNMNPWEFIFIDEPAIIKEIKKCKPHGISALETAPLAVVVCADETLNDVWIEDCSIASVLLQITAQSLGLGSCWIQVRERFHSENITSEAFIKNILQIPDKFKVLSIITIGYPERNLEGKRYEELQQRKIRLNRF